MIIDEITINFIINPKKGGIPANERKFKKIKNDKIGVILEKNNCLIFLNEEKVKEKIIANVIVE